MRGLAGNHFVSHHVNMYMYLSLVRQRYFKCDHRLAKVLLNALYLSKCDCRLARVLQNAYPAGTPRQNDVILTLMRRDDVTFDVICLLGKIHVYSYD